MRPSLIPFQTHCFTDNLKSPGIESETSGSGVSERCGKFIKQGLNQSEKNTIVDTHNMLRNKVALGEEKRGRPGPQPNAANMMKLSWDGELATFAQLWVEQCTYGHDLCRDSERFQVGQNIHIGSKSIYLPGNLTDNILSFYNEVENFDSRNLDPFRFNDKSGHYSQLVWAETYLVGCGYVIFQVNVWTKYVLVCNYGSAGNYEGASVYKVGRPGSGCERGTGQDTYYKGLCT
uniref:(California timema) hypothetical protein n=1 Tax=Timema californicum TaxID=61474 RepID=A0A7R9IXR8_TIMCA|nr:unnamed protein product [Timema californicum]